VERAAEYALEAGGELAGGGLRGEAGAGAPEGCGEIGVGWRGLLAEGRVAEPGCAGRGHGGGIQC
jgi:hypothetical protein